MPDPKPELSVILQVGGERERARNCLASLLGQNIVDRMEIILLDYGLETHPPLTASDHPAVKLIQRPSYEPIGKSRALAVREASAPIVAFIEDHCLAFDGWAQAIVLRHHDGWKAIGPEMHTGNPGVGISDAIALMNYAKWLPPARAGIMDLLVGHNTAYDREILESFGEHLDDLLRCDPLLQWKIQERGFDLYLDPHMKVAHINETEMRTIMSGYFYWNRMFAPTRAAEFSWPVIKRLLWVVLFPLIPLVRIAKLFLYLVRDRPQLLGRYLNSLPVQIVAQYAAAIGQAIGLVRGIGTAEEDFLRYELNQIRRIA